MTKKKFLIGSCIALGLAACIAACTRSGRCCSGHEDVDATDADTMGTPADTTADSAPPVLDDVDETRDDAALVS